ncbi:MAG: hypothetical protein ACOVO1_05810 [Chitinophagaceae bacterium]
MRLICTFSFIIITIFSVKAQTLTGIWRGTFEQNSLDPVFGKFSKDVYRYEVQLNNLSNGSLEGVTYSYLSTAFYGKASLKGIFDKKNKTLTIKETFLVEVKSVGKSDPCLMTCYLDYRKDGKLETLIGTYSSINMNTKKDCGNGTVYLERVTESDFEKEDFLKGTNSKRDNTPRKLPSGKNFEADRLAEQKQANSQQKPPQPIVKNKIVPKKSITTPNIITTNTDNKKSVDNSKKEKSNKQQTFVKKGKITKSGNDIVAKKDVTRIVKDSTPTTTYEVKKEVAMDNIKEKKIAPPIDDVLKERENKLATTIIVDSKDVSIEFYDNGEIDNDSISVYQDNKLVINNQRLSTRPIVLNLKFDEINTFYELITVAENLGDIPPNTALMVINYGRKRQEVFVTSDEKRNAKVIVRYKGK